MSKILKYSYPYLVIGFVWLLILILIDHTGEFPLIDDWAYAHGVKDYLDEGVLKISDWVAMTQVAHLFMGVGWSKLFGYSLETLREMTMLISFLGSFVFYWLTGYFSKSVVLRLIGTLIVTVNPIWMYLSHTFMTDVPFTVLFLALVLILIRLIGKRASGQAEEQRAESSEQGAVDYGTQSTEHSKEFDEGGRTRDEKDKRPAGKRLSENSNQKTVNSPASPSWPASPLACFLVLVLSSILVLIRQTGLGLGFSFLLWVLLMDRDRRGRWLGFGLVLVGVQVSTLVGYEWYMASIDALSTRYHGASSLSWILGRPWWPVRAAYYVLIQLQYLGMFLLPLLPFVWMKWRSVGAGSYSRWAYVAAGVVVLGMGVAVGGDILMNPRYTHLMQYDTVGHVMTIDFTYERLEFSRDLYPLWVVLHALGLLNMFLLMVVGSAKWGVEKLGAASGEQGADKRQAGKQASRLTVVNSAQSTVDRFDTVKRSRMGGLLFSVYRLLKAQRAFDHPVTWILLILGGYTVFISIGQFVFDRYLMLHLPLFVLLVLHLVQSSQVHFTKTVNSKLKTEGKGAGSGEQGADKKLAGKRASGQAVEHNSQFTVHSEDYDQGRVKRDEGFNTGTGGRERGVGSEVDAAHRSPLFCSTACLLAYFLLFLSFLFATIGVHDSFEWNRVRFGAIDQLEAQGITPHQIDGGAEYNSWQRTGPLQPLRLNEKSWWYVDGDEYAIAHEDIPGYERISAHPFTRYYGLERDTLYVVQRLPENRNR